MLNAKDLLKGAEEAVYVALMHTAQTTKIATMKIICITVFAKKVSKEMEKCAFVVCIKYACSYNTH